MAQLDKAQKNLAERLEPDEQLADAIQILKPGSAVAFASAGVGGAVGMLATMGFQSLGGKKGQAPDQLAEGQQIDISGAHLGQMAVSDRNLFLVPARPDKEEITTLPLAGTKVSFNDKGKLSLRRRTFLIAAADGRWCVVEAQAGLWKKEAVEAFSEQLSAALPAAS